MTDVRTMVGPVAPDRDERFVSGSAYRGRRNHRRVALGLFGASAGDVRVSLWVKEPEERACWVLDPLVGVGPLRFGMSLAQVGAALEGARVSVSARSENGLASDRYSDVGVTVIYGPESRLVAVAVDALSGPLLQLEEVELIARIPSEVRADLHDLARKMGVSVRANWSGDPEVAAWGLSLGAVQEWVLAPEGHAERTDSMITDALLVGSELAGDPYATAPVIGWRDVRDVETNSGAWPVTLDHDRPRWDWTPSERVGPLRFGMNPCQVVAALDGAEPAARRGWYQWTGKAGPWFLRADQFDGAGVTAHYWHVEGFPTLAAVTVHGRTGPQVALDGIRLIGRPVSEVDAEVVRYIEDHDLSWVIYGDGGPGPGEFNMYVRADRAGDTVVSGARFFVPDWEDRD